jgi:teichuronic acid biosynthesis glycosyltransferase TuaG
MEKMMQNCNIKVSIVTPVYNGENFLEETIHSVLNQTFTEFEYLLIDHASTDSSRQIMQKFQALDNRIKILELTINKGGPAYPRNEGMKVAQGEYIAFLDADDIWLPEKIRKATQIYPNK